jgi:hypothetical protein
MTGRKGEKKRRNSWGFRSSISLVGWAAVGGRGAGEGREGKPPKREGAADKTHCFHSAEPPTTASMRRTDAMTR